MRHPVGGYQLAQVDVGVLLEPLTSEHSRGFVDQLEPLNALAAAAPGFVWRLQTVPEAMARIDLLRASGPCRHASTLQRPFPRPDAPQHPVAVDDDWFCPA